MAKCFRVVGQGIPVRMSDADAFEVVVRDHDGEYCPKHVWKAERASAYRVERGDACLRKLVTNDVTVKPVISPTGTLQTHHQHKRRAA